MVEMLGEHLRGGKIELACVCMRLETALAKYTRKLPVCKSEGTGGAVSAVAGVKMTSHSLRSMSDKRWCSHPRVT